MKKTLLLIITLLFVSQLNAQVRDSSAVSDVIIQVDGTVFYGKVIEVNETQIKYRNTLVQDGPIVVLPRELIYMISYSNNTTQLITPEFGKKKIDKKRITGMLILFGIVSIISLSLIYILNYIIIEILNIMEWWVLFILAIVFITPIALALAFFIAVGEY